MNVNFKPIRQGLGAMAIAGAFGGLLLSAAPAYAGPTYTFATSAGVQLSDVGIITLTQLNATTVDVLVDLKPKFMKRSRSLTNGLLRWRVALRSPGARYDRNTIVDC